MSGPLAEHLPVISSAVLALGTILTGAGTLALNRRGQDIEQREQQAADRLSRRQNDFEQAKASVVMAREDVDRAVARADRADARADRAEERAERAERRNDDVVAGCDAAQRASRDAIQTLTAVVRDETARAAGLAALQDLDDHDHGTTDREDPHG